MTSPADAKRLDALVKKDENRFCADCGTREPRWASANLGVFICLSCSGIHRNLGVHISFVRSVNLDTWKTEQVEKMERIGNSKAKDYYLANLPPGTLVPREGSSVREMERWIRDKYEYKKYIAKGPPPGNSPKVCGSTTTTKKKKSSSKTSTSTEPRRKSAANSPARPLKIPPPVDLLCFEEKTETKTVENVGNHVVHDSFFGEFQIADQHSTKSEKPVLQTQGSSFFGDFQEARLPTPSSQIPILIQSEISTKEAEAQAQARTDSILNMFNQNSMKTAEHLPPPSTLSNGFFNGYNNMNNGFYNYQYSQNLFPNQGSNNQMRVSLQGSNHQLGEQQGNNSPEGRRNFSL
mmetsp:Transcript_2084/g.3019  ORF Transcript_2084/g.3019 Transcript_2084/m.3019 type:complete len:350 (+) Transcript_2084:122-1171(+)